MEVSNPQRFENFSIYINIYMKTLIVLLIVLLTGCSKAPDVLDKILSMAAEKKEQEKVLTDKERDFAKQSDEKEWENANDNK